MAFAFLAVGPLAAVCVLLGMGFLTLAPLGARLARVTDGARTRSRAVLGLLVVTAIIAVVAFELASVTGA